VSITDEKHVCQGRSRNNICLTFRLGAFKCRNCISSSN